MKFFQDLADQISQLGKYLRSLFEEPRENIQQLVVFFAILAVVILLAWLLINLVSFVRNESMKSAEIPAEKKPPFTQNRKTSLLIFLSVFAIAIIVGLASGVFYTSTPSFCNRCHLMNRYYQTWKKSDHKDVGCLACHQEPGITGFAVRKLEQVKYIPWLISERISPTRSEPVALDSSVFCNRCHQNILISVVKNKGLRVSHKEIISAGYLCTDCHSSIPHGKEASLIQYSRKDKCLPCHDGQTASRKCSLCHIDDIRGISERLEDYPKVDIDLNKFGILERF